MSSRDVKTAIGLVAVAGLGAWASGASFWKTLAFIAGSAAINKALAPSLDADDSVSERTITGSVVPARWLFGNVRTGGALVFLHQRGRTLDMAYVLSEGELDGIADNSVYINGEAHSVTGFSTTSDEGRLLTLEGKYARNVKIYEYFKGDGSQGASLRSATSQWSEAHRLNGVSWAHVELTQPKYNDREDRVWSGIPDIQFDVRGMKIQTPLDDAPRFTKSAADFWYWWMTERRGIPPDEIDLDAFRAAREVCDQPFFANNTPRYEVGCVVRSDDSPEKIQDEIDYAIAGSTLEHDGLQVLLPGVDRPVSMVIDDKAIIAPPVVRPSHTQSRRFNAVNSRLAQDEDYGHLERDVPEVKDSAAEARDRERLPVNIGVLRMIQSQERAQYLAAIALRRARTPLQVAVELSPGPGLERLALIPSDVVRLTLPEYGISARRFEIVRVETSFRQSVSLTLNEIADDIYARPAFTQAPLEEPVFLLEDALPAPADFAVEVDFHRDADGKDTARIKASWSDFEGERVSVTARNPVSGEIIHAETTEDFALLSPADVGDWIVSAVTITADQHRGQRVEAPVSIAEADFPPPAAPTILSAGQAGSVFRVRYRTTGSGIDIRYTRVDFDAKDAPGVLTEANWEAADQMNAPAVAVQRGDLPAVAEWEIEQDGKYCVYARALTRVNKASPIVRVGDQDCFDLVAPVTEAIPHIAASPNFDGTLKNAATYDYGFAPVGDGEDRALQPHRMLLPDRVEDLAAITDGDWNGGGAWPFNADASSYVSNEIDLGASKRIKVTASAETYLPGGSAAAATLKCVYRTTETGATTEVEVGSAETTLTARKIALKVEFSGAALLRAGLSGRAVV